MTVGQIIRRIVGIDDFPPAEEADRAVREAEMPWMSARARAEFAKQPEVQGIQLRENA